MKPEDQLSSLHLSKTLKNLGVLQYSLFSWVDGGVDAHIITTEEWANECRPSSLICSAFTAAELANILPNTITVPNASPFDNFRIAIHKFISVDEQRNLTNNFIVNYECDSTEVAGEQAWLARRLTTSIYDANMANALAKMLIYLFKKGLIKNV